MADMNDKVIHFGEFIRWNRTRAGKTTEQFSREVGVTARRLIAIETMARPDVHPSTLSRLANTLGIPPEDFDRVWQSTPVPVTKRKPGPTTDEAQRFARACQAAQVAPNEAMRRLRSWILEQPMEVQMEAFGFIAPHRGTSASAFTSPVDHLQEPADAARRRISRKAASSAKSPGSASTSENKRR